MEDLADAVLLTSWCSGDQEAFAVLVTRHHGLVRAACARQAASADVEDCLQAVFLVLARRPQAAARAPALAAWLQRVAHFVCRHAKRAAERRRRAEKVAGQVSTRTEAQTPEAMDHLDDCLMELPAKQRAAVVMHYLAGRSPDEIAGVLGTSRDNAYQLMSRGLGRLRHLLHRRGVRVAAPAFASLLAGEASAAAIPAPAHLISSLATSSQSAPAVAFASGALTSMTIATCAPIALAIGIVLAMATTTVAIAADSATKTPSSNVQHADALDQKVTLDFSDTPLADAVVMLQRFSKVPIAIAPEVEASEPISVTMQVKDQSIRTVLSSIERLNDLTHRLENGRYTISRAGAVVTADGPVASQAATRIVAVDPLDRKISLNLVDADLPAVIASIQRQAPGLNLAVDAQLLKSGTSTTLKVENLAARDALSMIERLNGLSHVMKNGVYTVQ